MLGNLRYHSAFFLWDRVFCWVWSLAYRKEIPRILLSPPPHSPRSTGMIFLSLPRCSLDVIGIRMATPGILGGSWVPVLHACTANTLPHWVISPTRWKSIFQRQDHFDTMNVSQKCSKCFLRFYFMYYWGSVCYSLRWCKSTAPTSQFSFHYESHEDWI